MTIQITKKIVGFDVQKKSEKETQPKDTHVESNTTAEAESIRKMREALAALESSKNEPSELEFNAETDSKNLDIKNTSLDESLFASNKHEEFDEETLKNAKILDYQAPNQASDEATYSLLGNVEITNNQVSTTQKDGKLVTGKMHEMHELIERPDMLIGSTYKVKTPLSEHAMYITINDMVLNESTEQEMRRPFEVFINSKNMDHFQWIVALTRIISAVFRKGGDITFLVEELRSVFDPKGGYFKAGGQYMPSLVAEIGDVIECHLKTIGIIEQTKQDPAISKMIEEKKNQIEAKKIDPQDVQSSDFPKGAALCSKCLTNAVILMDGCMTCLNCGDSKCG